MWAMPTYSSFFGVVGVVICLVVIVVYVVLRFRGKRTILLFGKQVRLVRFSLVMFMAGAALIWVFLRLGGSFFEQHEGKKTREEFEAIDAGPEMDTSTMNAAAFENQPRAADVAPVVNSDMERETPETGTDTQPPNDTLHQGSDQPTDSAQMESDHTSDDHDTSENDSTYGRKNETVGQGDHIGPRDQVGPGDYVGPRDQVGAFDYVGKNEQVNEEDQVGKSSSVGPNDHVRQRDRIGPKDQIGSQDQIGPEDQIGQEDQIGPQDFVQP
jgi:hypothetical protein